MCDRLCLCIRVLKIRSRLRLSCCKFSFMNNFYFIYLLF